MKVAIMGAGLAGLSCAKVLENQGIQPMIFEKRSRAGDRFVNGEAILSPLQRPINNSLDFFSEKFGITLKPISNIKKIVIHSENKKAVLTGDLGVTNIRGRHKDSFENQLAMQVKSEIIFNSEHTYEQLKKEFSHVVMAPGDAAYGTELDNFDVDLTVSIKGATIEGSFDPETTLIWLNNNYAPQGYVYLISYSDKEACLAIAYPDYPHNLDIDIDTLWQRTYNQVCKTLGQSFKITDNFQIRKYILGICKKPKIENTYFVGNCFGSIMPAFGFGQVPAILTGAYCAYDICKINNYQELLKPLFQSYHNSLAMRKVLEKMDNKKLDSLVQFADTNIANMALNSKIKIMDLLGKGFGLFSE